MKKLFIAAAIMLLAAACSKTNRYAESPPNTPGYNVTFVIMALHPADARGVRQEFTTPILLTETAIQADGTPATNVVHPDTGKPSGSGVIVFSRSTRWEHTVGMGPGVYRVILKATASQMQPGDTLVCYNQVEGEGEMPGSRRQNTMTGGSSVIPATVVCTQFY